MILVLIKCSSTEACDAGATGVVHEDDGLPELGVKTAALSTLKREHTAFKPPCSTLRE